MMIGNRIAALRNKHSITQEELAEALYVSRQAVQKWETNLAKPDVEKLILLAEYFFVSIDELVGNKTKGKTTEELRFSSKYVPDYTILHGWELYSENIKTEYLQLLEEGKDVSRYKKLINEISNLPTGKSKEEMCEIACSFMHSAGMKTDYPYYEPSVLERIKGQRRKTDWSAENKAEEISREIMFDKIHGAWLGRICGCLLGKPIEGIKTKDLDYLLKETGNFPLNRYILKKEITEEIAKNCIFPMMEDGFTDTIEEAPADDDTNYTVMSATRLIEKYGRDFKPEDVLNCWIDNQPKGVYCTAERVAFINFINGYRPPDSAKYKNPFREWIGAQIRGDYYGYINPGNPEAAADMAWRDASISHVKNGIYGEMFVAAMLACAAVCNDIKTIIAVGLAEIPHKSRLHVRIEEIIKMHDKKKTAQQCFDYIHKLYDENESHGWCHTISNAMIVVTALLYGNLDYSKSICMAVGACFDTDCNGATVGSIVGMIIGAEKIPKQWTKVINNNLRTAIFGIGTISVTELAELTMKHMKN